MLSISDNGIRLIKKFEGCRLTAYKDAAGVVTIGYGWTKAVDQKPLTMGMSITQSKAETLLLEGIKPYETTVNKYDSIYHWNQNQFDALVSFAYNIGSIDGLTAKGTRSLPQIAEKFMAYQKAGGKTLSGLVRRRYEEKALFLTPLPAQPAISHTGVYSHKDFVRELQSAIGAKADGIAGKETLSKTPTISKSKNNRHPAVKPVQSCLNATGYPCGACDGIAGAKFDAAVKAFQTSNGCIADGELTAQKNSWKKLLKL